MTTPSSRPKAYSYLRFSTPEQQKGDSARRQIEETRKYAEENNLDLDEILTFRDLGVSAFRRRNVDDGQLGDFLTAVDGGKVHSGSWLLVENFDRLSRTEPLVALDLFRRIVDQGITIATVKDRQVYTRENLTGDISKLMLMILHAHRAHEESRVKGERVRAAWANKRQKAAATGQPLTAKAPAWLRLNTDAHQYEAIKDRAELIKRIFSMALEGYGKAAIAMRFNSEGIEPFGDGPSHARKAKGWHPSYVQKVLDNEAVIGKFQPMRQLVDPKTGRKRREPDGDPLEGYFPTIIDPDTFHRVRHLRRLRRTTSGPKGKTFSNILNGLVTCGHCGAPMHYVNKGKPPKGNIYLSCSDARNKVGDCEAPSVRYDVVLSALLNSLSDGDLDLRSILGVAEGGGEARQRQALHGNLETVDGQLAEAENGATALIASLEKVTSDGALDRIAKRLDALEADKARLSREKERLEGELREATHPAASRENMVADVERLVSEWNAMVGQSTADPTLAYDVNLRLNTALRRLVENVAVARDDSAKEWVQSFAEDRSFAFTKVILDHYQAIIEASRNGVSMTTNFRNAAERHLIVYGDGTRPSRYVAAALRLDEEGGVKKAEITVSP